MVKLSKAIVTAEEHVLPEHGRLTVQILHDSKDKVKTDMPIQLICRCSREKSFKPSQILKPLYS